MFSWKNLGIRTKILAGFAVIVLLFLGVGSEGYRVTTHMQRALNQLFEVQLPMMDYLLEADRDMQQMLVAERSMIFTATQSEQFKGLVDEYEANMAQVDERMGKFFALVTDERARGIRTDYERDRKAWEEVSRRIVQARKDDTREGRRTALDLSTTEGATKFETMRGHLDQLTQIVLEDAEQEHTASKARFEVLGYTQSALAAFSLLVAGFMVFFIARSILGPVNKAVALANDIRHGDLSRRLKLGTRDEMGRMADSLDSMADVLERRAQVAKAIAGGDLDQEVHLDSERDMLGNALKDMVANMNDTLVEVRGSADQIAAGAEQVSEASQSLSQGSTEQASAIEEINSSMTEIGGQTRTNAQSASEADKMMRDAVNVVEGGKEAGQAMAVAMEEISEASQQMAKIIKVIDEIAFQTNLLALNAAVEAARAGRHGKGFAVVAEEVRNLAGRSARAAQETTLLIETAVSRVESGMDLTRRLDQSFEEIVQSAGNVAGIVAEIASSSNEQAMGVAQVNEGMNQVDQVTQQNTANAEQTASAATVLSDQAEQLQGVLRRFRLRERGQSVVAVDSGPAAPRGEGGRIAGALPVGGSRGASRSRPGGAAGGASAGGWDSLGSGSGGSGNGGDNPEEIISLEDDFAKY
jgi:methyl-accepting chemotaxis protein